MFWGLSSALDLYDEYVNAHKIIPEPIVKEDKDTTVAVISESENEKSESSAAIDDDVAYSNNEFTTPKTSLNILLYGGSDPRHIIKTLAKRYTHKDAPQLNFYMIDGCMEITARNILLLSIALESPESFNLVNKTHLFMDIYGNTLMRPTSYQYMIAKANTLIKMITDDDVLQCLAPMLNIEGLKYVERDGLENSFIFWQPKVCHVYNIENYWTNRVRTLLGPRYDHRGGAFDWDLCMTLKDRGAQQICSQEYRYWRECGIAFVFPEYEHCKPNKSFAAGLVRNGETFLHRGYMGDIQTGPFCTFGLRSSEERMHASQHGDNDYRATDITERNLFELFHELQTGVAYKHDLKLSRKYGSVKLLMGERLIDNECSIDVQQSFDRPWISVPGVKLHWLSNTNALDLQNGHPRWQNFFDIVFVGHNLFQVLREKFDETLCEHALLLLETNLLTVNRKETLQEFESKLMKYATSIKLKPVINYQAINTKHTILKFKKINE